MYLVHQRAPETMIWLVLTEACSLVPARIIANRSFALFCNVCLDFCFKKLSTKKNVFFVIGNKL